MKYDVSYYWDEKQTGLSRGYFSYGPAPP